MESERDPPLRVGRMPVGSFERQNYGLSRTCETSDPLRPLGGFDRRLLLPAVEVRDALFDRFQRRTP